MARPRNFDPDEVLGRAREVFWQKGFQGTSLDDITEATGLNKPSLYAAFGDKNALFLKVLDRYHAYIVENAERIINEGPSARAAIERWLTGFVPRCSGEASSRPRTPGRSTSRDKRRESRTSASLTDGTIPLDPCRRITSGAFPAVSGELAGVPSQRSCCNAASAKPELIAAQQ